MHLPPVNSGVAPAVTTPTAAAQRDKLDKESKEFAGILINTMWSEFQNDPLAPQAGEFSDPAADNLKGLGLQAMSMALAARGGLGLAAMIEHQLDPPAPAAAQPAATMTLLKPKRATADMLGEARSSRSRTMEKLR